MSSSKRTGLSPFFPWLIRNVLGCQYPWSQSRQGVNSWNIRVRCESCIFVEDLPLSQKLSGSPLQAHSRSPFLLPDLPSTVIGISPGQGELLGKPASVAVIDHRALRCLPSPRADADGGPRTQQKNYTGSSAAVSLTAPPFLMCGKGDKARHFQWRCKIHSFLHSLEE